MIVIKAPAGFDPTWPAIPVDPTWHEERPFRKCSIELLDLAALLGPKDCPWCEGRARRAAPSDSVEHQGLTIGPCEHCPDGKLRQRVALAIETPCACVLECGCTCGLCNETTHVGIQTRTFGLHQPSCGAERGVRLRVEYTAQVDAVVPIDSRPFDPDRTTGRWVSAWPSGDTLALMEGRGEVLDFIDRLLPLADWSPSRVAVLISDVRRLGVGDTPMYAPTMMDVRPFTGPVAELSEVLA